MTMRATIWIALLALAVPIAKAQTDVTIREINTIPQAGIDAVKALGANVTSNDIQANIRSDWTTSASNPDPSKLVRFDAVVLSDPRYSGLSSVSGSTGAPSRIHFFVRDVSAATDGPGGNDLQVVDGNYPTTGSRNLFVGDVVRFTGYVAYFGTGIQFSPESVEFLGTIADQSLPESIVDPVVVTIDQLNESTGDLLVRANWDNFNALNQQYVRIEGVQVWQSPNRTDSRPNWALRDVGTGAIIANDDISLAYRNDRSDYPSEFFAENDFTAPPVGASVNIQGFALLRSTFDPFQIGDPAAAVLKIVPWTPEDLEITQTPPNISNIAGPSGIPGNAAVTVSADVVADQTRTLTGVKVVFTTSSNATEQEVSGAAAGGDGYTFDIPAQADGDFVVWNVVATDSEGAESVSASRSYRVLYGGIADVSHIQQTADGGPGDSPFRGLVTDMDLEVTIMVDPANVGTCSDCAVAVQDGTDPWSGIVLYNSGSPLAALAAGDVIRITNAEVEERFGMTRLRNFTFETVSQGGTPYAPVVVTTDVLQDADIAEAHEGMFLRAESVVVTSSNADAPSNFGEFAVSSDGTADNALRVNDLYSGVSYVGNDPSTVFSVGERLAFVEGTLWWSFSNYKLEPETFDHIGAVTNTAVGDETLPTTSMLHANYPNPFNPTTSIRYDVAVSGPVSIAVYDALGRLVRTLASGEQIAGSHEVRFDAAGLSSGLYLVRMVTPDRVMARTMTLVK